MDQDSTPNFEQTSNENMRAIKHQFMVYRNGIVAEALRNSGMPYHVIFGLQLPQLAQIARSLNQDKVIAQQLWNDKNVRESRLLACYLFPKDCITLNEAVELARSVQTTEEADILCFRLLRYLPFAEALVDVIKSTNGEENKSLISYCATALRRNIDALK